MAWDALFLLCFVGVALAFFAVRFLAPVRCTNFFNRWRIRNLRRCIQKESLVSKEVGAWPELYRSLIVIRNWQFPDILTDYVHLLGVVLPRSDQPGADETAFFLEKCLADRAVIVEGMDIDNEGYPIVRLYAQSRCLNLALVQEGLAWPDDSHLGKLPMEEAELYLEAFETAKKRRLGLWSDDYDDEPTPPWLWPNEVHA